jgi:hypothetical protein
MKTSNTQPEGATGLAIKNDLVLGIPIPPKGLALVERSSRRFWLHESFCP